MRGSQAAFCLVFAALQTAAAEASGQGEKADAGLLDMRAAAEHGSGALQGASEIPFSTTGFGFLSDYYCTGRVYDEPRRVRLKCTKNPPRKFNCACDGRANSQMVSCSCDGPVAKGKAPVPLRDKNERITQDFTALDP